MTTPDFVVVGNLVPYGANQEISDDWETDWGENDLTVELRSRIDRTEGVVLDSGVITPIDTGTHISANKIPGETAQGTITGERVLQTDTVDVNGTFNIVLTGLASHYSDKTLDLGDNHLALGTYSSHDDDGANNRTTLTFIGDYSGWLVVGANTYRIVEPIGLASDSKDGLQSAADKRRLDGLQQGLAAVAHDTNLGGDGTDDAPLRVIRPLTQAGVGILEGFISEGWQVTGAVGPQRATEYTPTEIAALTYAAMQTDISPRQSNVFVPIRLTAAEQARRNANPTLWRLVVVTTDGDVQDDHPSGGWTNPGGGNYYQVPAVNIGVGENYFVEEFDNLEVDGAKWNRVQVKQAWGINDRPASISKLPVPMVAGTRYILSAADTVAQPRLITALNEGAGVVGIEFNDARTGINGIRQYPSGYSDVNLRGKSVLSYSQNPPGSNFVAANAFLGTALDGVQSYAVDSAPVTGNPGDFEIQGLPTLVAGTGYYGNVGFTTIPTTFLYPPIVYQPADYTAVDGLTAAGTDGAAIWWANSRKPAGTKIPNEEMADRPVANVSGEWPLNRVAGTLGRQYMDLPATYDTIATDQVGPTGQISGTTDSGTGISFFSPTVDLDDANYRDGLFVTVVTITMSNTSSTRLAWERNDSQNDAEDAREAIGEAYVLAASLFSTAANEGITDDNGVIIHTFTAYDDQTAVWNIELYHAHNNLQQAGIMARDKYLSGTTSFNYSIVFTTLWFPHSGGASSAYAGPTFSTHTWTGDVTLPIGTANNEAGAWTAMQTVPLAAGKHTVDFNLFDEGPGARTAFGKIALRLRRTRASVTTTMRDLSAERVNLRGTGKRHFDWLVNVDAEAGDTFVLEGQFATDNIANAPTGFTFNAVDQRVDITSY